MRRWIVVGTLIIGMAGSAASAWAGEGKPAGKSDAKMMTKTSGNPMEGLSADERKFVEMKLAKKSPEERKEKLAKLGAMKPAERKAMIQKMMKSEQMDSKMHKHDEKTTTKGKS